MVMKYWLTSQKGWHCDVIKEDVALCESEDERKDKNEEQEEKQKDLHKMKVKEVQVSSITNQKQMEMIKQINKKGSKWSCYGRYPHYVLIMNLVNTLYV